MESRPAAPKRAGIWSFTLAVIGIIFLPIIFGPLAVYFGWVSREYDKEDTGWGTAGFVLGILETAVAVLALIFLATSG